MQSSRSFQSLDAADAAPLLQALYFLDSDMHKIHEKILLDPENPFRSSHLEDGEVPIRSLLEGYVFGCAQSLCVLDRSLDKARVAIESLRYSYTHAKEFSGFTPDEYIEFAIENYFMRSHSVYDRSLIFVNKILNLGISNESIKHDLVVTNSHVKRSGLDKVLRNLRKKCTEYRLERNKIVHHGDYSEETWDIVAIAHRANNLAKAAGEEPLHEQEELDKHTNAIIDIQVDEFQENLDKIIGPVEELFDAAMPIYQEKKVVLGK